MAEEKAKVSKGVSASKAKAAVVITPDTPEVVKVYGKSSEKATRGTLDKR